MAIAVLSLLAACAVSNPPGNVAVTRIAPQPETNQPAGPASAAVAQPVRTPIENTTSIAAADLTPAEMRTRHATFKLAGFDELPGWEQDDLVAGWSAFRSSCTALQRRDAWREVCAQSTGVARTSAAIRAFFESRFSLLRILNTDASRDGDITGYFEPLLEGRRQPQGDFNVPVLGVPRDLYTLDWINVPAAQRRGIVHVKPQGNNLVALASAEPGSVALDLRRFVLDSKDRRLRVRLSRAGTTLRAEPYPTRGELAALGLPAGVDAPVLAWVNDALALYAMQVQGSGRIRMADSTVLRVQYADQNGHPFKPLRVVARASDRVVTRGGIGTVTNEPDQFDLEDDGSADAAPDRTDRVDTEPDVVVKRGLLNNSAAASGATGQNQEAAANAVVEELLRSNPKRLAGQLPVVASKPSGGVPSTPPASVQAPGRLAAKVAATRPAFEPSLLSSDPSYVFFKVSADQTPIDGPPGALGVPLTPGRSIAVDPRVTPLGYPVFLATPAPQGSNMNMRRLVFAQDTGGAIRGAVRADFFWGFGADAGRLARSTRHRGQMWLLMPRAEATRLGGAGIVRRGIVSVPRVNDECLIADDSFCQEPD